MSEVPLCYTSPFRRGSFRNLRGGKARALADTLSARKVISLITGVIRSQLI